MTLPSWPELHGAVTHFPVALLLAGAAFDVGARLFRKDEWRTVGFWCLVVAVVAAVPSIVAGLMTAGTLFSGPARPPEVFYLHRAGAFTTAAFAIACLALRVATRDRRKGGPQAAILLLTLCAAAAVGYTGYLGGHMVLGSEDHSRGESFPQTNGRNPGDVSQPAGAAEAATPPAARLDPQLVARGEALFRSESMACMSCHMIHGKGGTVGPDLTHVGREYPDTAWHIEHLKNPAGVHPGSMMPSYNRLSEAELKALAAFLATRR